MRVMVYPEMEGKTNLLVVPSPAARLPPLYLSGDGRTEAIGRLRTELEERAAKPVQLAF